MQDSHNLLLSILKSLRDQLSAQNMIYDISIKYILQLSLRSFQHFVPIP